MKKLLTPLGIIVLTGLVAVPVFAGRGGRGDWTGGPGPCWQRPDIQQNLTEEQRTQLEKLHTDFYADTSESRHELWAKTDELDILLNKSDPDLEKAKSLQKEISNLRGEVAQKRLQRDIEARKIAPEASFGRGHSKWQHGRRHMKGGPGFHRRGDGAGPCWKE